MNAKTQELAELIVSNQKAIKRKMIWEVDTNQVSIMSALISAENGKQSDPEKYAECKKILKKSVSIFSEFRGISSAMVVTKMTLADNPSEYVEGCIEVYKKLRSLHKLTASPYMVMAAMTIYEHGGLAKADENIEKLEEFYKKLKKAHPFLITDTDRGYLSMLVTCNLDLEKMEAKIEENYQACKSVTINKDGVNSLAQILALSDKPADENAQEVKELIKAFSKAKCPLSKSYGLGALGALLLLDKPMEEKVAEVAEISAYLKTQKPFKWHHMGKRTRTIYAILIAFMANVDGLDKHIAENIGNTVVMVLVEELIMTLILLCMVSNTATSTSSSSN